MLLEINTTNQRIKALTALLSNTESDINVRH